MSTQPESLWLADALEELGAQFSYPGLCGEAAAELRRLVTENEALTADAAENLAMYYRCRDRADAYKVLNTELVEALRWYVDTDEVSEMEGNEFWLDGRERARAALEKAQVNIK